MQQSALPQGQEMINRISHYLEDKPVQKAYLFGSFARGEADADSDIDLLVSLDYSGFVTGLEFFTLWEELEELTGRKVDLVTENSLSPYVADRVESDKILIYEKAQA